MDRFRLLFFLSEHGIFVAVKNFYEILGVARNANADQIKKAYFVMAKKYHPDSGDESEVKKFHEVAEAYKILSDPESRKAYDLTFGPVDQEVKKAEDKPVSETMRTGHREAYRDEELKEFHKNRYKKAIFRVIGFSLLLGVIGYFTAVIIVGVGILGGVAGLLIGFSLSIHKNFKVESFFDSKKSQKAFRVFTWFLFLCGLGYFVWLIARDFI
ncbi:MAG: J domain-containing protein [Patescibacteria group bacterium]